MKVLGKWATKFNKHDAKSDRFRYAEPLVRRKRPEQPLEQSTATPPQYSTKFYDFPEIQKLLGVKDVTELKREMERLAQALLNIGIVISVLVEFGGLRASDAK